MMLQSMKTNLGALNTMVPSKMPWGFGGGVTSILKVLELGSVWGP